MEKDDSGRLNVRLSRDFLRRVQTGLDDISSSFQRPTNDKTYLDEILALGLCDERLQLGRGECVDQARFGDDEKQNLGAGEDGELVSLMRDGVSDGRRKRR